jgi:fructokinase
VSVIDTVGAGDAAHAALLARLDARGLLTHERLAALTPAQVEDALAYANAAAALVCARRGADPARADEIKLD